MTRARKSRTLILIGVSIVIVASTVVVVAGVGRGRSGTAQAATPGPGSMATITPYQLSSVGVRLTATNATPPVTPDQADTVAGQLFTGPVMETVLANCDRFDISPAVSEPCYAVSVKPPNGPQYDLYGPDAAYDNSHPSAPPTFELALVDAATDQLIAGFSAGTPPNPPATS
jgi:hypothetical protein